jgi:hypothetical protein
MAEITRDDVRQAVRDELANVLNDIHYVREASARIDQRTSDLDASQQQISNMTAQLQAMSPALHALQQINPRDIQDIKLRVQNIEKGIAQIVQFLHEQNAER